MDFKNIIYEKKDRIAKITLNRPHKMNALNDGLLYDLERALEEADQDDEVRVVILTGAGKAFSAGYDLSEEEWLLTNPESHGKYPTVLPEGTRRRVTDMVRGDQRRWQWYERIWNLSKPTIAQVNGHCLAGGCYLQMLCDLAIASENATFGHPGQRRFGGVTGMPLWIWLLGARKAKELLFTGNTIDAKEAERIGLVNKVVSADKLEEEVNSLAQQIASIPPDAVGLLKQALNTTLDIMGMGTTFRYLSHMHAFTSFVQREDS